MSQNLKRQSVKSLSEIALASPHIQVLIILKAFVCTVSCKRNAKRKLASLSKSYNVCLDIGSDFECHLRKDTALFYLQQETVIFQARHCVLM